MSLENILNNDETKIIFLKAIMLGINYGKSDKIGYYVDNIEKEIKKITLKKNSLNNDQNQMINNNHVNHYTNNNTNNHTNNYTNSNHTNNHTNNYTNNHSNNMISNNSHQNIIQPSNYKDNNESDDINLKNMNINILKSEKNISFLEGQKIYTINLIQKLSSQNYGFNYSKINLLKNNLIIIVSEIEKNKLLIKKNKDELKLKEKNIIRDSNKQNIFKQTYNERQMQPISSIQPLMNTPRHPSMQNIRSPPVIPIAPRSENLVGELEKTLTNLSSILIH